MSDDKKVSNATYAPRQNTRGGFYPAAKAIPGRASLPPSMASKSHSEQVAATKQSK